MFPDTISLIRISDHFTDIVEKLNDNNPCTSLGNEFERSLPEEADVTLYLKPVTMTELKEVVHTV